jgi:hypothetical protein
VGAGPLVVARGAAVARWPASRQAPRRTGTVSGDSAAASGGATLGLGLGRRRDALARVRLRRGRVAYWRLGDAGMPRWRIGVCAWVMP